MANGTTGVSYWRAHCELLWFWDVDSSGTQEVERPPLEAGTRELAKGQ
jgi:hypothetical protein